MRFLRLKFLVFASIVLDAKPLSVDVSVPSAILINAETGAILYGKEIHERYYPASTTKIATALYVLEKKKDELNAVVCASREALSIVHPSVRQVPGSKHPSYRLETDGTHFALRVGEKLPILTLLYGLMLPSGNDAANVLAEATSGTIDNFMVELNQFLKEKGLRETHFANPHGLPDPNHWTTAFDMAELTRVALKNPLFCEIVSSKSCSKPGSPQVFMQGNRLLRPGPYFYPKAIGVKTGNTMASGRAFVAAATSEGRTLIAVLLKCSVRFGIFKDAIKLFEAAFAEKKVSRTLFAQESDRFSHRIPGAKSELQAVLKEDMVLEYFPAEEPSFRAEVEWNPLKLPILEGTQVGCLRCVDSQGNILIEKSLFAANGVSKQFWAVCADFYRAYRGFILGVFLGGAVAFLCLYFMKKGQKVAQR